MEQNSVGHYDLPAAAHHPYGVVASPTNSPLVPSSYASAFGHSSTPPLHHIELFPFVNPSSSLPQLNSTIGINTNPAEDSPRDFLHHHNHNNHNNNFSDSFSNSDEEDNGDYEDAASTALLPMATHYKHTPPSPSRAMSPRSAIRLYRHNMDEEAAIARARKKKRVSWVDLEQGPLLMDAIAHQNDEGSPVVFRAASPRQLRSPVTQIFHVDSPSAYDRKPLELTHFNRNLAASATRMDRFLLGVLIAVLVVVVVAFAVFLILMFAGVINQQDNPDGSSQQQQ